MMVSTLDRAGIAARVPHAGSMCLLDALLAWDAVHALCTTSSHADPAHPLRCAGVLPAPAAIEIAAQAAALHGALAAPPDAACSRPTAGFLASGRLVRLLVPRLDDAPGPLAVRVERQAGDGAQALYRFALHDAGGRLLVDGRIAVVLNRALAA